MKSLLKILPRKVKRIIHEQYTRAKGCSYNRDGLITFHQSDFLNDPLFRESYRLGKATGSWGSADIEWRVYVACWAANKRKSMQGDLLAFPRNISLWRPRVNSTLIASATGKSGRRFRSLPMSKSCAVRCRRPCPRCAPTRSVISLSI